MSVEWNTTQLKSFMAKWEGHLVPDMWGNYLGECVSLVKQWLAFNKWPYLRGNAIEWQHNGDGKNYIWIPYRLWVVPHIGDMAVFNVGPYGHIGIVASAKLGSLVLFHQNWPQGNNTDPAKQTLFVRTKPLGYLRKL